MNDNNIYYKKQFIGLIITALALQGILSLIGYWGFYSITKIFMWVIRIFLLGELAYGIYHYSRGKKKPIPWIGEYSDKLF